MVTTKTNIRYHDICTIRIVAMTNNILYILSVGEITMENKEIKYIAAFGFRTFTIKPFQKAECAV